MGLIMKEYRKFIRYVPLDKSIKFLRRDQSYEEHKETMGWCETFESKDDFFRTNFIQNHSYKFLWDQLNKRTYELIKLYTNPSQNILSLASGGCGVELKLSEDGYDITCSDMKITSFHKQLEVIFPAAKFLKIDFLKDNISGSFDNIMAIEVVLALSPDEFKTLLKKSHEALKNKGYLFLTVDVSPPSWRNNFIIEKVYLLDTLISNVFRSLFNYKTRMRPHHLGWRFKNSFVKKLIYEQKYKIRHYEEICYENEPRRVFNFSVKILKKVFGVKITHNLLYNFGKFIRTPYRRYFLLQK
tara:strand:- start:4183 stop:5079 length:897 start_codon:yes stop_codon:yes gene_type:complete